MHKPIALIALVAITAGIVSPSRPVAQSGDKVAPVPGPYQAPFQVQPTQRAVTNPYSNPGNGQTLPYWMRQQPPQPGGGAAQAGNPTPQNYIPGWVWSPYAPNAQGANSGQPRSAPASDNRPNRRQSAPQPGQGYWPGPPPPGYGMPPWGGQPGYAPGFAQGGWPSPPNYNAPQGYGAPQQPQR